MHQGQIRSFVFFIGCENAGLNFLKVISVGSIRFLGFILWFWVVAFWAFPRAYSAAVVIEDGTIIGIPPEICQTLNLPVENARCKFQGELQGTLRLTWEVVSEAGRGGSWNRASTHSLMQSRSSPVEGLRSLRCS